MLNEWQKRKNEEYKIYLSSPEWKHKRDQRLKIDGNRCQACGTLGSPLNPIMCHHLNYKSVGHENPYTTLVSVCKCCHTLIHNALNRKIDPDGTRGWSAAMPLSCVWETMTFNVDDLLIKPTKQE